MNKVFAITGLIILILGFTGCGDGEIIFNEGNHNRETGYEAAFKTQYAELDNLTVHIATRIFSEDTVVTVVEQVEKDYQKLEKATKENVKEVTVYVVEATLSGRPQMVNNAVFCTISDIESGEYRECLTGAFFGAESYWKIIGLNAYIFADTEEAVPADEALQEFYQNDANYPVLSMLPLYFSEDFAEADTVQNARRTACALTEYMVAELGVEEFLKTEELAEYRQKWLEELGLDMEGEMLEDRLHRMAYSYSQAYPAILEYENFTFYLNTTDWIATADEYYIFFRDFLNGYDEILNSLQKEEPEACLLLEESISTPVYFYYMASDDISHATSADNKVYISSMDAAYHEMFHVFLPVLDQNYHWYYEGLTVYLTEKICTDYMKKEEKEPLFQSLTKGELYEQISEEDRKFIDHVAACYSLSASLPETVEEMDGLVFMQAVGMTTLGYPELPTTLTMAIQSVEERSLRTTFRAGTRQGIEVGNDLTYPEATVCISYLAEKYGLETVILVAQGKVSFEDAFHGDFETILEEVKDSLPELKPCTK
ncbi:MAG: hypothetical protein ACI4TB_10320 [Lachnospiraceae bacterium]